MWDTILNSDGEIFQSSWLHILLSPSLSLSLFLDHTYLTSPATSAHAKGNNNNKHNWALHIKAGRPLSGQAWCGAREIDFKCIPLFATAVCFNHLSASVRQLLDSSRFEHRDEFEKQWHAEQRTCFLPLVTVETNIGFCLFALTIQTKSYVSEMEMRVPLAVFASMIASMLDSITREKWLQTQLLLVKHLNRHKAS